MVTESGGLRKGEEEVEEWVDKKSLGVRGFMGVFTCQNSTNCLLQIYTIYCMSVMPQ